MAIYCIIEVNNYLPTGKCKIGYSDRPFNRMGELQTGNSNILKMYAICNGNIEKETELHHLLHDYRINNEWFNFEQCEYQIIKYFDKQMSRMFFYYYAFYNQTVKLIW